MVDPPIYSTRRTVETTAYFCHQDEMGKTGRGRERSRGGCGGGLLGKLGAHKATGTGTGHRPEGIENGGMGRDGENRRQTTDDRQTDGCKKKRADRHTDVNCHVGAIK